MLRAARLDLSCWWEHVDSHANVADGGSRIGTGDLVAANLGITLTEVPMIDWPAAPRDASAETWSSIIAIA